MTTEQRRLAERGGRRAEVLAAWLLRLKGYRILAERYKTPAGEIDLIVSRRNMVVFVEVKRRSNAGAAIAAVTSSSRARIARAASLWVSRHPAASTMDHRFDVVLVLPGRLPVHMQNVFGSDGRLW